MKKEFSPIWIVCMAIGIVIFFAGIFLMASFETDYTPVGTKYEDTNGDGILDTSETLYERETKFPYLIIGFIVLIIGSFLSALGIAKVWEPYKTKKEVPPPQPEPQPRVSQVVRAAYNLGIDTSGKSEDELMDEILKHEP